MTDMVNNPPHYTKHPSGVECIEIAEHMNFNIGSAVKYLWRCDEKGSAIENLQKAAWFIQREIERRHEENPATYCLRCGIPHPKDWECKRDKERTEKLGEWTTLGHFRPDEPGLNLNFEVEVEVDQESEKRWRAREDAINDGTKEGKPKWTITIGDGPAIPVDKFRLGDRTNWWETPAWKDYVATNPDGYVGTVLADGQLTVNRWRTQQDKHIEEADRLVDTIASACALIDRLLGQDNES